jgi:hypothetical protein
MTEGNKGEISNSSMRAFFRLTFDFRLATFDFQSSTNRLNEFQCKPSAEANLFGYAKAQPEIMKSEALNNKQLNIYDDL